jgi:hypothetical protein
LSEDQRRNRPHVIVPVSCSCRTWAMRAPINDSTRSRRIRTNFIAPPFLQLRAAISYFLPLVKAQHCGFPGFADLLSIFQ